LHRMFAALFQFFLRLSKAHHASDLGHCRRVRNEDTT
jgi:hypothetical protein